MSGATTFPQLQQTSPKFMLTWNSNMTSTSLSGQNAGFMNSGVSWGQHKGYISPVVVGETYTLGFSTLSGVRLEFSDNVLVDRFGLDEKVTLILAVGYV